MVTVVASSELGPGYHSLLRPLQRVSWAFHICTRLSREKESGEKGEICGSETCVGCGRSGRVIRVTERAQRHRAVLFSSPHKPYIKIPLSSTFPQPCVVLTTALSGFLAGVWKRQESNNEDSPQWPALNTYVKQSSVWRASYWGSHITPRWSQAPHQLGPERTDSSLGDEQHPPRWAYAGPPCPVSCACWLL